MCLSDLNKKAIKLLKRIQRQSLSPDEYWAMLKSDEYRESLNTLVGYGLVSKAELDNRLKKNPKVSTTVKGEAVLENLRVQRRRDRRIAICAYIGALAGAASLIWHISNILSR